MYPGSYLHVIGMLKAFPQEKQVISQVAKTEEMNKDLQNVVFKLSLSAFG